MGENQPTLYTTDATQTTYLTCLIFISYKIWTDIEYLHIQAAYIYFSLLRKNLFFAT